MRLFNWLKKPKTKGCLYGKTRQMKIDYFKSLSSFIEKDIVFYNEQYEDLLPHEKEEFNKWLLKTRHLLFK